MFNGAFLKSENKILLDNIFKKFEKKINLIFILNTLLKVVVGDKIPTKEINSCKHTNIKQMLLLLII